MDHMIFSSKMANQAFKGVQCPRENNERKMLFSKITQFMTMTEHAIGLNNL